MSSIHILNCTFLPYILLYSCLRIYLPDKVLFRIFSAKISIPSSSMPVSCIVTSHNFSPLSLICLSTYKSQSSLIYCSFHSCLNFLYLPPDTRTVTYFYKRHSVSFILSISGTNLTLIQETVTYCLNTHCRFTVGLGKEWILIMFDKVVFGWAVRVAVVQLSPGLLWITIILSVCTYRRLLCVLRYIGWIDKINLFIRYILNGLIL